MSTTPRLLALRGAALTALISVALSLPSAQAAPQLQVELPLNRTAYQTNELIDLAVVRNDSTALPATDLTVTLTGEDASKMVFTFPAKAAEVAGNEARATEYLHLNGWLLRPGKYMVEVAANGATAKTAIEVFSHIRRSSFKLINWGSPAQGAAHTVEGEDSLGFNLIFGHYRPDATNRTAREAEFTIRGGADYMQENTMSGAHQMDLRMEADWSDPYVTRGGTARVTLQAFASRTTPNAIGIHYYDEPGLTWHKHPKTGEFTPHNIPSQDRSFKSAFGIEPLQYNEVKPDDAASVARWNHWARWKESFMEAAWKEAAAGVRAVRPDYISITQSQYGWNAYTDGYYFNVVRSLPVISGHGGYSDGPGSYFYPGFHLEFGRMRELNKPNWYLPTWYNMNSDNFRLEQYLSFINNLQGMASPPWFKIHEPNGKPEAAGVVEANKTMARLGTIFTTMPITRGEVAVLYSLSQAVGAQVKDMKDNYEGGLHTRARLLQVDIAGKMLHTPIFPIVEEDVLDGTLAAHHKAVILAGVNTLDPKVVTTLQEYIKAGGTVLVTDDSQVQIPGATKVGAEASVKQYNLVNQLWTEKKQTESMLARGAGYFMKDAEPLAKALKTHFDKLGIKPVLDVDSQGIVVSRQAMGDIEYLFAVNATYDFESKNIIGIKSAEANINLPADGRPVYDAMFSRMADEFKKKGNLLSAKYRFGPGQMRMWARTARPIGGVQVMTPTLFRDYTVERDPIHVTISAAVVDNSNKVLAGAAPLRIRVIDPLGVVRYDLYRAIDKDTCKLNLPLAANDAAGQWKVEAQELLSGTKGTAAFNYTPAAQVGALAGSTHRAVFFGNDRENAFRFVRNHHDITIVKGASDYNNAAAERLAAILKPWGVRSTIVNAADVNKPRQLTTEEAATWVGIDFGRVEEEGKRLPTKVGFAVNGPVILMGNPTDNPLIATVEKMGFLPYRTSANLPGRGRGYLAWQRDAVGIGQESITLIAPDATGMAEAVGTLYEAAAGLDPLTPLGLPATASVAPAKQAVKTPEAAIVWQAIVPDRPLEVKATPNSQITVLTNDGSLTTLDAAGKIVSQKAGSKPDAASKAAAPEVPAALKDKLVTGRVVKYIATANGLTAIGYWGGTVQVFDAAGKEKYRQLLLQDIAGLVWTGNKLIAGLADGRVLALEVK